MENLEFTLMPKSSLEPQCHAGFLRSCFRPRHIDSENPAPVIVDSLAYVMGPCCMLCVAFSHAYSLPPCLLHTGQTLTPLSGPDGPPAAPAH